MRILYIIPARAGSKGLPGKNVKLLDKKPLVSYSIDFALENIQNGDELCISTNDESVLEIAREKNVSVPFVRPENLSSDTASSYDVLLHALRHYEERGQVFDAIMLLQPTSPFRMKEDYVNVMNEFDQDCDMVVTVKSAKENPYFNLFEEKDGFLKKSKAGNFLRRQDCPPVYAFNGSIYLIRCSSLLNHSINEFKKVKKVLMPEERSLDIDTMTDWILAEYFSKKINNENC